MCCMPEDPQLQRATVVSRLLEEIECKALEIKRSPEIRRRLSNHGIISLWYIVLFFANVLHAR